MLKIKEIREIEPKIKQMLREMLRKVLRAGKKKRVKKCEIEIGKFRHYG